MQHLSDEYAYPMMSLTDNECLVLQTISNILEQNNRDLPHNICYYLNLEKADNEILIHKVRDSLSPDLYLTSVIMRTESTFSALMFDTRVELSKPLRISWIKHLLQYNNYLGVTNVRK